MPILRPLEREAFDLPLLSLEFHASHVGHRERSCGVELACLCYIILCNGELS